MTLRTPILAAALFTSVATLGLSHSTGHAGPPPGHAATATAHAVPASSKPRPASTIKCHGDDCIPIYPPPPVELQTTPVPWPGPPPPWSGWQEPPPWNHIVHGLPAHS